VDGEGWPVIRDRQIHQDLWLGEHTPNWLE